jgi:RNA-directed DNA polymerase
MTMDLPQTKPIVGSLSDLEHRLGIKRGDLAVLLQCRAGLYHPFKIPKKQHPYPGKLRRLKASEPVKYRQIDDPVKQLKDIQRRILATVLSRVELPAYMFGAVSGRTLLGHAKEHVPNQSSIVVRMDISSYYPNITCEHVYYVWNVVLGCPPPIARLLTELTTFDWHLPQGAPTSPAIANIFLASIYAPICLASEQAGLTITTWVDDLIFSGSVAHTVMETVRATLAAHGFKMAPEKREIFGPKDQKNITGTRLGRFEVRVTHKKMSELRAAIFRLAIGALEPGELEKYRRNLSARIAHIATIHKGDAAKVRRHAIKSSVILK